MSIGTNIKALREDRKLTQEQVAEALGISFHLLCITIGFLFRDFFRCTTNVCI